MSKYGKNILIAVICFLAVVILNFILPRLLPGTPIAYLTGFAEEDMTPAQYETYRWDNYYACLARQRTDASPGSALSLAEYLIGSSILTPERTVLDIGGGMGEYALAFAPRCKWVTVLDRSGICLDIGR